MRKKTRSTGERMFWESGKLNNATFIQYYNRLVELSISMFDWQGLPDSIDPRFLELGLFSDGKMVFFKDEALAVPNTDDSGYLCLRAAVGGPYNVYNVPKTRHVYATDNYQHECTDKDSVIIWNNQLRTPSRLDVEMFAERLYLFDRIIDVNVKSQKTPVLIKSSEQQRLPLLNLYQKYDGNQPFIFADSSLDAGNFGVLKTDAPYVADKIYQLKNQYWNECLTYLGISNLSFQKKERLVTDEAIRSMGGTIASRYSRLQARRKAADEINRMFGLNITVDYREDYREIDDENVIVGESANSDGEMLDQTVIDLRTNAPTGGIV